MLIIPAIDIKDKKCVRLVRGDPQFETVYSTEPVFQAKYWEREGAKRLHIVDLDENALPVEHFGFLGNRNILDLVWIKASIVVHSESPTRPRKFNEEFRNFMVCGKRSLPHTIKLRVPYLFNQFVTGFAEAVGPGFEHF